MLQKHDRKQRYKGRSRIQGRKNKIEEEAGGRKEAR